MTEYAPILDASKRSTFAGAATPRPWLFVDGASAFGGHEVMLLRWLEELASDRAVTSFVLARYGSALAREASRHATVLELPRQRAGALQKIMGALRDAVTFARTIFSVRPELCVVAEGCLLAQPLFVLLARALRRRVVVYVPLVQTSASMGFGNARIRDRLVRWVYANAPHAWITLTREQAHDFRRWAGVRRPIFVLPNTVSSAIENRRPLDGRDAEASTGRRLRILVLGRIEAHQKGLDTLLSYLSAHPELGERMCVTFVGSGPFEPQVRGLLCREAALASWVSLRPWSPAIEALESHDVLLMTSRYEGVPLVMLEAMALGVPVVAPDLPGTREFVQPSALFPSQDMRAAFRILEGMIDPEARRTIAERNRASFEASASNAAFATAVKALTQDLQQLLGSVSLRRRGA